MSRNDTSRVAEKINRLSLHITMPYHKACYCKNMDSYYVGLIPISYFSIKYVIYHIISPYCMYARYFRF